MNHEIQPQDELSSFNKLLENLKDIINSQNIMIIGDKEVGKSTFINTFSK